MAKLDFEVGSIKTDVTLNEKNSSVWVVIQRGRNAISLSFKSIERLEQFSTRLHTAALQLWVENESRNIKDITERIDNE